MCLAGSEKPVLILNARHGSPAAKKASEEDAEGLQAKVPTISVGASVMLTQNMWTSKGISECILVLTF